VNFFRCSQIQVTVCANGKEKSKLPVEAQLFCRRFDCPAFLLTAEETGQTNRRLKPNLSGGALNRHF
jgi:hypothetical protein